MTKINNLVLQLLQKMADYAFKKVDRENTGVLDQSEFYYGLLIVHSKFSEYFGPVVCRVRISSLLLFFCSLQAFFYIKPHCICSVSHI